MMKPNLSNVSLPLKCFETRWLRLTCDDADDGAHPDRQRGQSLLSNGSLGVRKKKGPQEEKSMHNTPGQGSLREPCPAASLHACSSWGLSQNAGPP